MDLKIFVMTDDDIRLARRIQRDIAERGRTIEDVLAQYNRFVKSSYDEFIKPTMKYADIIIPHGRSNTVAIDFVVSNLKTRVPIDDLRLNDLKDSGKISASFQNYNIVPSSPIKRPLNETSYFEVEKESQQMRKIEAMLERVTNENDILRDIYVQQLLNELQNLKQKRYTPTFDSET